MNLTLDNTRLREIIPNIIHEVKGETPLYEKLLPWITSARLWLESEILGTFQPHDELYDIAEKIIVLKAFANAIPSLDITLSPAGFAVINTEGRAPASKERIERLIASLCAEADDCLASLCIMLHSQPQWRLSPQGQTFLGTFIPHFGDVTFIRRRSPELKKISMLDLYRAMRDIAVRIEQSLEELYLGPGFMNAIRTSYPAFNTQGSRDIYNMIHAAVLRYVSTHISDTTVTCPDEHEVWHLARPILARLNYWPQLTELWQHEMAEKIYVKPFRNNVPGGYYF